VNHEMAIIIHRNLSASTGLTGSERTQLTATAEAQVGTVDMSADMSTSPGSQVGAEQSNN
jgi:hypothetical protein